MCTVVRGVSRVKVLPLKFDRVDVRKERVNSLTGSTFAKSGATAELFDRLAEYSTGWFFLVDAGWFLVDAECSTDLG
jgi:hypothetical protein